ncbi:alpha-L-fucosidase [Schleiferilactobacillus shenzhenensis]|uniref:alpha-L-fucosidase n=1 Tax=Schleiferilactobacillus shenzhenensis LY-73 TaxID=1231336 RepID=U4TPA8_9LACO|nr:alpha-L-fucosidase [Schleiferilactobacillus shenzhenensis]ERL66064.1 alpha-L-fucosidase [Schleiferilactobacillus shenzhenensis LY-73]
MAKKEQPIVNIHRQDPPQWFKDAGFGIFIHWGVYSVPAYAPVDVEDFGTIMKEKSMKYLYENQPYAEWYGNSMKIPGSPAYKYHHEHYGDHTPYTSFAKSFQQTSQAVDVEKWADMFAAAGAKYVVVVTKHHDGFVMYPTEVNNPNIADYHLNFDYVGQLAEAVRKRGMHFGVYYSSLLDWTFTTKPIESTADLILSTNKTQTYLDYAWDQWHELIDRYHPDILWSDIGYPDDPRLPQLFKDFYQVMPDGLVNDRWSIFPNWMRHQYLHPLFNWAAKMQFKQSQKADPKDMPPQYYDYRTIEYTTDWHGTDYFETTRGMDKSFGYNQFSRPQDYITADEVRDIVRLVKPQKGRLLLNVGPEKDGTIPPYQEQILKDLAEKQP